MSLDLLQSLNKMSGVLGSAWFDSKDAIFELGEAMGGPEALPLVQRVAQASRSWANSHCPGVDTSAMFVGSGGRVLTQSSGTGVLVAFAETAESAGLLKVRMRETASKLASANTAEAGVQPEAVIEAAIRSI